MKGCPFFGNLEVVALADLDRSKAEARARESGVPRVYEVSELLADPEIEIVVNLTIPRAHASVALAALQAGKSVYNEKSLALTREEAKRLLAEAASRGLCIGCAPDTFLGAGIQTCRKLLDEGFIGAPVGATAFFSCHGHENWHPNPAFYYQKGGGPMFDMGPYYLSALVNLLGPVRRVTASARRTFPTRTITSQPYSGGIIEVEVPTHLAGVMEFACGAVGTLTTSFDVWAAEHPRIEIYGTEGTLMVPDPNGLGGQVRAWRGGEWKDVPLAYDFTEPHRGVGVADMAWAMQDGRPLRASGELAYHVLDVMESFHDAAEQGAHVAVGSTCERPAALKVGPVKEMLRKV
ncbi:MAG TPA: Gfo/Idh/MocA family oxidoreductase [Armatimonadota bacterium]